MFATITPVTRFNAMELTPRTKLDSNVQVDKDVFYRELGRRIAARRSARKVTQAEIADAIGSSRASIANIEAGRQGLQVHQLYPLAAALGVEGLGELIPLEVPRIGEVASLGDIAMSEVGRAQIESLVRNAVAAGKPKGRQ